jgi:hypothetical protein
VALASGTEGGTLRLAKSDETASRYDEVVARARALMLRKNHDYGESWREMRPSSITDQILVKVLRVRRLEELQAKGEQSMVAEGIESEYLDILNYAVFGVLRLAEEERRA